MCGQIDAIYTDFSDAFFIRAILFYYCNYVIVDFMGNSYDGLSPI